MSLARNLAVRLHRLWITGEIYEAFYSTGNSVDVALSSSISERYTTRIGPRALMATPNTPLFIPIMSEAYQFLLWDILKWTLFHFVISRPITPMPSVMESNGDGSRTSIDVPTIILTTPDGTKRINRLHTIWSFGQHDTRTNKFNSSAGGLITAIASYTSINVTTNGVAMSGNPIPEKLFTKSAREILMLIRTILTNNCHSLDVNESKDL